MSDVQPSQPDWHSYIQDMIDFSNTVLSYTDGLDESAFFTGDLTYHATIHNILLIGEAANNIPPDVREAHRNIPWGDIIGTRNRIVHTYREINQAVIWEIIQSDIPTLIPQMQELLEQVQEDRP